MVKTNTEILALILAKKDEMRESFDCISFDGQNCDDCPGWDGYSDRCVCGNRRVYWAYDEYSDSLYAIAD